MIVGTPYPVWPADMFEDVRVPDFGAAYDAYLTNVMLLGRREYDRRRDQARKLAGMLWCDWTWIG